MRRDKMQGRGSKRPIARGRRSLVLGLVLITAGLLALPQAASAGERPNFVVLLIDDAGMTDLGAFGGEARTPNIDALASGGARFTGYHTSPLCSPSRAMLLTGVDNHRAGVGTIPELLTPAQRGRPEYQLFLREGVPTLATRLREAGYRTYMTGKWHLGHGPGQLPFHHGFDRSFILDASGADNYEQRPYMPYYTRADWFEDDQPATLPADFYSSRFLIEQLIRYLDEDADRDQPFLAYVAFQALHIPLQAPRELTETYIDTYTVGWEAIAERRWARARAMGLVPESALPPPRHPRLRPWASLSAEQRALYAKSMAVHAAMLEAMDAQIGRLMRHLRERGQFENTMFIVTADNGPEPTNPVAVPAYGLWMALNGYTHDIETLGERGSIAFIGPEWAAATATPGRLFKFHASEGGVRVPLIIGGPGIAPQQIDSLSWVTDLAPTLYDYAGLSAADPVAGLPLDGRSLRPVLSGSADRTYGPDEPVGMEVSGNALLIKGDYKLTRDSQPWGDGRWRLHRLRSDPGEVEDLREIETERFAELMADYAAFAERVGVVELPEDFNPLRQLRRNAIQKQVQHYRVPLVLLTLLLIVLMAAGWRRRRAARGL